MASPELALLAALLAAAPFAFEAVLVDDAFFAGKLLMLALTAAAPPLAAVVDLVDEADFAAGLLLAVLEAAAFDFEAALVAVLPLASAPVALLRAWRT